MEMWLDVDVALTEVPVNIMPLVDDTDFKTREESVVYNQAGLDLVWNFTTTAGVTTQTAVVPTTAGVYDWTNQGNGMYTIEIPASGGGSINNDTEGQGWFTGVATGILPWRGPVIGFRAAALNNALVDGGDLLDVNVTTIADTAQTANDNGADINAILEDTGTTIPGQISGLNNFDPAVDTVARVTLVDTTTTNTDMRGTNNAATEAKQNIIDTNVDAILVDTGTTIPNLLSALNDLSAAEVNAQVLDVLNTDTFAEPAQGTPASTATLVYKIGLLYKALINKKDTNGTVERLYNSNGSTVGQTRTVGDDGSTATKGSMTSGA